MMEFHQIVPRFYFTLNITVRHYIESYAINGPASIPQVYPLPLSAATTCVQRLRRES